MASGGVNGGNATVRKYFSRWYSTDVSIGLEAVEREIFYSLFETDYHRWL